LEQIVESFDGERGERCDEFALKALRYRVFVVFDIAVVILPLVAHNERAAGRYGELAAVSALGAGDILQAILVAVGVGVFLDELFCCHGD